MIQLKSIHFSEALSEETNAFTANVWFKGKKVGYAKNDGQGGCTFINAYPEQRELFKEAEQWAKEQPQIDIGFKDRPYMIDSNMENVVDDLLTKWLLKKEEKRIQNLCKKNIVIKEGMTYKMFGWKNITIEGMLANPIGEARVKKTVTDFVKEGKEIVNKNIPEDWLK